MRPTNPLFRRSLIVLQVHCGSHLKASSPVNTSSERISSVRPFVRGVTNEFVLTSNRDGDCIVSVTVTAGPFTSGLKTVAEMFPAKMSFVARAISLSHQALTPPLDWRRTFSPLTHFGFIFGFATAGLEERFLGGSNSGLMCAPHVERYFGAYYSNDLLKIDNFYGDALLLARHF